MSSPRRRRSPAADVLAHCAKFLPPAKLPKQVVIVAELPKSDRAERCCATNCARISSRA